MNGRIKELAEHCTEIIDSAACPAIKDFDYEKFAEMIVRECAVIVGSMEEPHQDIAKLVKQHFGVK